MNTVSKSHVSTRLGQMFFSNMSHRLYDTGLYRFVTRHIWRCPTERLMDNYVENISDNHMEVGVGSGYFLERTLCADYSCRLELLDLNERCLEKSAARLSALRPKTRRHNVLEPCNNAGPKFRSIGMNYVLHCIPGGFHSNQHIFQNVCSRLEQGGVFFGSTLIAHPWKQGKVSWLFMRLLNVVGILHNSQHTVAELKSAMESCFSEVDISIVGDAAVFRGVK